MVVTSVVSNACSFELPTDGDKAAGSNDSTTIVDATASTTIGSVPDATAVDTAPPTAAVPTSAPTTTTAPTTVAPTTTAAPSRPAGAVDVIDIIDGDTIKIRGGQSVRLIGIDTPERGQCGYTEAAFVLASVIRGRPVVLVPGARTDTDRYGRLLRYVEVDGVDANLEMIRSGRAIARYDSRDGYGRHPREDLYVRTDAATPSTNNCTQAPAGLSGAGSGGGGGTDPRFRTCKDAKAAGYGNYVRGVDPEYDWYRDGDGDGIACE